MRVWLVVAAEAVVLDEVDFLLVVAAVEPVELVVPRLAVVEGVPVVVLVVPVPLSPVVTVAAEAAVEATDCRAMPSPRALATPMLRDATRARLRAAGWGRFDLMAVNLRTGRERSVRGR